MNSVPIIFSFLFLGERKDPGELEDYQVQSFEEEYNVSLDPCLQGLHYQRDDILGDTPVANASCPKCSRTVKASELLYHIEICPCTEFQRSTKNYEVAYAKIPLGLIQDNKYKTILSTSEIRISARKGTRKNSYKIFAESVDGYAKKFKLIFKYKTFHYTISCKQTHSVRRLQLPSYIKSDQILKLKIIKEL